MILCCRNLVLALVALGLWLSTTVKADPPCLRMGVIMQLDTLELVSDAAERVFTRAGLCLELVEVPVRRAEQMLLHGELDGEMLRSGLWVQQHADQVVALPTPFYIDQMMAVSLKSRQLDVRSLEDLGPFRVAIMGGHRWAEARLAGLGVAPVKTASAARYMELLRVGRVDVGLMEESLLRLMGSQPDIAVRPLEPLPYFTVLRQTHEGLVPRLDEALRWVQANPKP